MKAVQKITINILLISCLLGSSLLIAAQDSFKGDPSVKLRYFINNNNIQYVLLETGLKAGKKFQPLPGQVVKLFLDSNGAENLVAKTSTDANGKARIIIPPSLKEKWNNNPTHNFIALMQGSSPEDEITAELEITKARIAVDTSNNDGVRTVNVKAMFFENSEWVPAKDVEVKIGINRLGGMLPAGDEESYTTDSTGAASAEFKRDSLPGDQHGNIMLAARVEDNDLYGNLLVEKTVPWGIAVKHNNNFFHQRTLWSTRSRTPWWLLFMAYSIVIGVWATIIYLVVQIIKIKKLGVAE